MSQPEITLWRAVILQQFIDATSRPRTHKTNNRRQIHHQVIARTWLLRNSDGFRIICELADIPPIKVRRLACDLAADGWPYTKFNISNGPNGAFA